MGHSMKSKGDYGLGLVLLALMTGPLCAGDGGGAVGSVGGDVNVRRMASAPPVGPWTETITAFDQGRLDALAEAIRTARGQAARIAPKELALLNQLADSPALPLDSRSLAGSYRCRKVSAGGDLLPFVAYEWFNCRMSTEGESLRFEKVNGSQRTVGALYPYRADELLYLGAGYYSYESPGGYQHQEPAPNDSCNEHRNEVALLRRIGQARYVMTFPKPLCESEVEFVELLRK